MLQKFSVSLLAAVAIALGALGLSSGVASACSNNAGYIRCDSFQQGDYYQQNDMIQMPVPYSNQFVRVPGYMWNYTWTRVTDEAGGFPRLDLRDRRWMNFPLGYVDCVQERDQNFDYGTWFPGMYTVEGRIPGNGGYY